MIQKNKHFDDSRLQKHFILAMVTSFFLCVPAVSYSQNLLCRPWSNTATGIEIGESFTSKVTDGVITFFGDHRPVALAQLIYSHPINDVFLAASGELVTAGIEGQGVRLNVYFPNKEVRFFVTARCSKV